jgi:type IV secretion system protein VirB2
VALTVQQSLLKADGGAPMLESARWIEGVMLGEIALGVCVIAVALIGALMLTGRLPLREGMRVVVGCFVLLGAPVIASGLMRGSSGQGEISVPPTDAETAVPRAAMPPADYDPYAGASLGQD